MANENWENYVYPGTTVLRNKADILDPAELQRFERGVTAIRIQEQRENPVKGDFDLAHLQAIHRAVFKDVYEWAGQLRTVDMIKGSGSDRTLFAFTEEIPGHGAKLHQLVKDAHYGRGMEKQEFAKTMSNVYAEVNQMHPFREGNGRAAREYMNELAKQSGYKLDYEKVDKDLWNEASKQSAHNNQAPMEKVFYEITTVERAVAFDKLQPGEALSKHPELDHAYKALMNAREAGSDVSQLRAELSRDLHAGKLITSDVTGAESLNIIARAADYRDIMVRDAAELRGTFKGEVIALSSHHALLKITDMLAVRYERENLDRAIYQNDRVTIQYSEQKSQVYEQGKEPARERGGRDMQMEHTLEIAPH